MQQGRSRDAGWLQRDAVGYSRYKAGMQWGCSGNAVGYSRYAAECSENAIGVQWECSGDAEGMEQGFREDAAGMQWECTWDALGLQRRCNGIQGCRRDAGRIQ